MYLIIFLGFEFDKRFREGAVDSGGESLVRTSGRFLKRAPNYVVGLTLFSERHSAEVLESFAYIVAPKPGPERQRRSNKQRSAVLPPRAAAGASGTFAGRARAASRVSARDSGRGAPLTLGIKRCVKPPLIAGYRCQRAPGSVQALFGQYCDAIYFFSFLYDIFLMGDEG